MRVYLDNCCYNRPFDDQHNLATDYTEWRQNQFDDLTIEELGRATRESGKQIRSVLEADAAVSNLLQKT